MNRTLKTILTAGAFGLASLGLMPERAESQVSGSVEYIQSEMNSASYPRFQAFYKGPADSKGFTFMEFYKDGKGYFGKTSLSREIANSGIELKAETTHSNEPWTRTGFGVQRAVPGLPKNVFLRLGVLPVFAESGKKAIGDKTVAQYYFSVSNLPLGIQVDGFGDWNLNTGDFGYGEFTVGKKFGPLNVKYNPALLGDGDAIPSLQNRVLVGVNFGGSD